MSARYLLLLIIVLYVVFALFVPAMQNIFGYGFGTLFVPAMQNIFGYGFGTLLALVILWYVFVANRGATL